nr:3-oxoacyl-[acyl-carrier-protein] synthase 3 [Paraburkholderia busanensis]
MIDRVTFEQGTLDLAARAASPGAAGDLWLRACAAYTPPTLTTVGEAIQQGWYGEEEHAKDNYLSVAVEQQWWPADMALATARTVLGTLGADAAQLGLLTYTSIHRHGHARLWQPAAALQHALGASQALAFSLAHGCNGMFVASRVALDTLAGASGGKDALVIGSDRFGTSSFDRWRGDYGVVYGDAAAAALFGHAPGFAKVQLLSIAGVPELEGMHRHVDEHAEHAGHRDAARHEFGVRESKKGFMERFGRERFFEAIGHALTSLRDSALKRFDLHANPADWLLTPHVGQAISAPLYEGMFRDLARRHFGAWGRQVGHTGTADQFLSLVALARSGQLENGQRVLLIGSGAGFSCALMLLEVHDVSLAAKCEAIDATTAAFA